MDTPQPTLNDSKRLRPLDPDSTHIDNERYNEFEDDWWDHAGPVGGLHDLNPTRADYFEGVIRQQLGEQVSKARLIDVGCGGGILSEEMARRGYQITGFDISQPSLDAARRHAVQAGVQVEYRHGSAYELELASGSVDVVIISDVLEHLHDLPRAVAELTRVLRPNGLLLFDTFNRTFKSYVQMILLAQNLLKLVYPNAHIWKMFITPEELERLFQENGLQIQERKGLSPKQSLPQLVKNAVQHKHAGAFHLTDDLSVHYIGYAIKGPAATGR